MKFCLNIEESGGWRQEEMWVRDIEDLSEGGEDMQAWG